MVRAHRTASGQRARAHPGPAGAGQPLLFEIGVEELPSDSLRQNLDLLSDTPGTGIIPGLFTQQGIAIGRVQSWATPRRLVLQVKDVAPRQDWGGAKVFGPAVTEAYGPDGRPTAALQGFLRSQGSVLEDVTRERRDGKERVAVPKRGRSTRELLPGLLEGVVRALRFEKTMRWDASRLVFGRPIRWLLALYGRAPIPVTLGVLTSGARTYGLRCSGTPSCAVRTMPAYFQYLRRQGILWDHGERRRVITESVRAASCEVGGDGWVDPDLLDEVTFLTEAPQILTGAMRQGHVDALPHEVIVACLSKYQRLFPVQQKEGQLLPHFVAVVNGRMRKLDPIRRHYEEVLEARLADCRFFYTEDMRHRLDDPEHIKALDKVTFHEKLGSMFEKQDHLRTRLVPRLAQWLQLSPPQVEAAQRAAGLCKTDLVTQMVKEFPSLQGVIGRAYATTSGESGLVADAIYEHYLPKAPEGPLPGTMAGAVLGLADRLDTLAGFFWAGLQPTSSADPFALRRCAAGLVRILVEWKGPGRLPLRDALEEAFRANGRVRLQLGERPIPPDWIERLFVFLQERLEGLLLHHVGNEEVVRAVLSHAVGPGDDFTELWWRAERLKALLETDPESVRRAAKVVERTGRIVAAASGDDVLEEVHPDRLVEPLERDLWTLYNAHLASIRGWFDEREYQKATERYGQVFFDPVHKFFEQVMVNVDARETRRNRLALLSAINRLYTVGFADLSQLEKATTSRSQG